MATKVLNKITQVTRGVTLSDTTAGIVSEVARLTVPRGTAIVIPPTFTPVFEFLQPSGAEMSGTTEIYFGIIVPSDERRIRWLGSKYMYRPWADLSLADQQSKEFERACTIDLGVPYLPLGPEEAFVISLYHEAQTCDANTDNTHITFAIPYFERTPQTIMAELAERMEFLRV